MSSAATKKVLIKVESAAEQQENITNQRKTLKVLQGVAIDKENLTGRPQLDKLSRLKAAVHETTLNHSDHAKRKKIETKEAGTQTSPDGKSTSSKKITEEDLCGEKPSEYYFERLAEKRREALEQTLEENQRLYERIDGLEEELNTSRQQVAEAKNLVEVLTEMLNENQAEEEIEAEALAGEPTATEESTEPFDDDTDTDDSNSSTSEAKN